MSMGGKRIIPGRVVRLRINPQDCIAVADIIDRLKQPTGLMSFDQAVRIALSVLIENARERKLIPRRDGFEYTEMMGRFVHNKAHAAAILEESAHAVIGHMWGHKIDSDYKLVPGNPHDVAMVEKYRVERRMRFDLLKAKLKDDAENMTDEEKIELMELINEFNKDI